MLIVTGVPEPDKLNAPPVPSMVSVPLLMCSFVVGEFVPIPSLLFVSSQNRLDASTDNRPSAGVDEKMTPPTARFEMVALANDGALSVPWSISPARAGTASPMNRASIALIALPRLVAAIVVLGAL